MNLLQKYGDLKVIDHEGATREFSNDLIREGPAAMHAAGADDTQSGSLLLKEREFQGKTAYIEIIGSNYHEDSLSTLYEPHPIFNNRGELIRARRELIETIEDLVVAAPGSLVVQCPARKRAALLRDLATRQLVDLMVNLVQRMSK